MPKQLTPLSPEWWVERLYRQMQARRPLIDLYDAYYRGDHPLPWLAPQAREEFRRLVRMTRSNYMGLVVDAVAERLQIEGFRLGGDVEAGDAETWRIWQSNHMDSDSDQAILESLITGQSYTLVAPNPQDERTPHVWVEHPTQAAVEYEPGTARRVRAAGLKVWDDDWTGNLHATLYLPDAIHKFQASRPTMGAVGSPDWVEREVRGEQPNGQRGNPLGEVPLVEWPNNPRLLTGGVSEIADVIDIQDRVNKTLFDRMQTQEFGVDPQKWAKAFPDKDGEGNPNVVEFGRNRMITTDIAETAFGNFAVAPLSPYSEAKREDVKDIASRTRTPAQYLLGEMNNVNGQTLKASESGLISKTRQRMRPLGESAEDTTRLLRKAAGLPAPGPEMETLWRNPEFRTEGEITDAAVKKYQSGIASLRQARVDVGYSETTIRRLEQEDAAATESDPILRASRDLLNGAVGGDTAGNR